MNPSLTDSSYTHADAEHVRTLFPALSDGIVLLDGPGGTQMPRPVSDAISEAMIAPVSNEGGDYPASRRASEVVEQARIAVADLVGGDPRGVAYGPSTTAMTYRFAQTLSTSWTRGDNIVVTQLDHDANVRPWVQAAVRAGVDVRWAAIDTPSCELPTEQFATLVDARTRVVAVTGASNLAGTRPDIPAISSIAHAAAALVWVDGVHLTAHSPVDMAALGADFYATSSYKWCGPHLAAVVADPALLATLQQDKLLPATDEVPERFEWGTLPFETLAGIGPAVDFLAGLAPSATAVTRRERVLSSMAALERYEDRLGDLARDGIRALGGRIIGDAARRTPTVSFLLPGIDNHAAASALGDAGIGISVGNHYALEAVRAVGIDETAGTLRVGLAPYNVVGDVHRVLEQLEHIVSGV